MSTKENAAVGQLLSLLESRYAMRVLWALKDGHPQTFRLLQDSVGTITPNTLNTRIKEMRAAGLMTHGSEGYTVFREGTERQVGVLDLEALVQFFAANSPYKSSQPGGQRRGRPPRMWPCRCGTDSPPSRPWLMTSR